jgi:hypothetical protein
MSMEHAALLDDAPVKPGWQFNVNHSRRTQKEIPVIDPATAKSDTSAECTL